MAGKKTVPLPIRWRDAVTEHPDISSVEWAVAMALSMRMDNKSGECHPGFGSLGRVTRLSRTSVKKAIKGLEAKGLIRVRRRRIAAAYHDTNIYTALMPRAQADLPEPQDDSPRAQGDLPRAQGDGEVGRQAPPVSSETQGERESDQVERPVSVPGEVEAPARLERKPKVSDLPPRLRNLPPDHPAVKEHRAAENARLGAEVESLFGGGPTSDERDKDGPDA
jgi:hypothetical protein